MRKKLLVGSVFAAFGIFASFAVSHAQFGGGAGVPNAPATAPGSVPHHGTIQQLAVARGPDIENEVRNLYLHLQWEKQGGNVNAELVAKHAELLITLTKYMAADRISRSVADLEMIVKEMPGTDEANRAAAAIQQLKGDFQIPQRDPNAIRKQ